LLAARGDALDHYAAISSVSMQGLQSLARLQYYSKAAKTRAVPVIFNMRAVVFAFDLVLIFR